MYGIAPKSYKLVKVGASILVIGTAIEKELDRMFDFAKAIHWKDK